MKNNFLSNKEILAEIARCKASYSSFLDPAHAFYDAQVHDEAEITPELITSTGKPSPIIRLYTYRHIPLDGERKVRRNEAGAGYAKLPFRPFVHLEATLTDGSVNLTEVLRSHWSGGFENGHFDAEVGRMSDRLGMMIMLLVKRYAMRPNFKHYTYNDDMQAKAVTNLCKVALQFDESKSDNPFAYFTTCATNSFNYVLTNEKKHRDIRDAVLEHHGVAPSSARQDEEYYRQFALPPLAKKRGRPTTRKEI